MQNPELKLPEKWRAKVEDWKPWLAVAARLLLWLAGTGGLATGAVANAEREAEIQANRAKSLEVGDRAEWLREAMRQHALDRHEELSLIRERLAVLEERCR